eukprot:2938535-Pleurochrysis_carterae.AAC.1
MRGCGGATSATRSTKAKKPRAERERSASTQTMRMPKWGTVHASGEVGEECGGDCRNRTPLEVKK